MRLASAVLHNEKVYVMTGEAPDNDTLQYVFSYNVSSNYWDRLPPPGHAMGELQIIDGDWGNEYYCSEIYQQGVHVHQ